MTRRNAMAKLATGASPLLAAGATAKQQYYELCCYQFRNGTQFPLPKTKWKGLAFSSFIAENSPFVMTLQSFATFAETEQPDPSITGYLRYERTILKAFSAMPEMTAPKAGSICELRTYESPDAYTLRKKIEMFNNGEMQIFQRLGMNPVFFGEALVGTKLPRLTYMLSFEDLAARDLCWKAFGADPAWQKLRATPGLSDAEIVSNISNMLVRDIR